MSIMGYTVQCRAAYYLILLLHIVLAGPTIADSANHYFEEHHLIQQCLSSVNASFQKYWSDHNYLRIDPCKIPTVSCKINEETGMLSSAEDHSEFEKVSKYLVKYVRTGSNVNADGVIQLPLYSIPRKYTRIDSFNRSIMNAGNVMDPSYLALVDKLAYRKKCITIVVIGGSVTCAGTRNRLRRDAPRSVKDSYTHVLENVLNRRYPGCIRSPDEYQRFLPFRKANSINQHIVDNRCHGGVGTGHWIDAVASWKSNNAHNNDTMDLTDLVIVETAVNDYEDHQQLHSATELLLRILQKLKNSFAHQLEPEIGPALLFLGVSTVAREPWKERGDTLLDQLLITKAYGVPHLSLIDAFRPLESPLERYWLNDIYRGDDTTHITTAGHGIIAGYVSSFFQLTICRAEQSITDAIRRGISSRTNPPSAPLFVSAREVALHVSAAPHHVRFHEPIGEVKGLCKGGVGFSKYADVQSKFGLIGAAVGDRINIVLPSYRSSSSSSQIERQPFEMIKIEYLSSYEGMGVMKLTLFACDSNCRTYFDKKAQAVASAVVDCLDSKTNFSISRSVQLDFGVHVKKCLTSRRLIASNNIDHFGVMNTGMNRSSFIQKHLELFKSQVKQEHGGHGEPALGKSNCVAAQDVSCGTLKLTVEIVAAADARVKNKVKLLAVSLY
jgi:hypothetical protein